jgi:hypothetical protein
MPAGWLPDGELSERLREAVPPGIAPPDDRDRESDWPKAAEPDMKNAMKPVAHLSFMEDISFREDIAAKW